MKKPQLLREYYEICPDGLCNIGVLNEAEIKLRDEGYMILTGIIQKAGEKNGNGRIYSERILRREIENYQTIIEQRRSTGEIDHPDTSIVSLKDASHMVLRTWWEGNEVWGTIKILKSTPKGKILEGLLKDGVSLGISSRGLGSIEETNQGIIVQEDFQLLAFDIVSEPSTRGAFMKPNNEFSSGMRFEGKAQKIYNILNEIKRR